MAVGGLLLDHRHALRGRQGHATMVMPVLSEKLFNSVITRERKRADRSEDSLGPLLLTVTGRGAHESTWRAVFKALQAVRGEADVIGWIEKGRTVGLLVPDTPRFSRAIAQDLKTRLCQALSARLDIESRGLDIRLWAQGGPHEQMEPVENACRVERQYLSYAPLKRAFDFSVAAVLLILLSPLLAIIAALVKLTSPGPALFRQQRVGQRLVPFHMLKFRSMKVNADHGIHKEFVSSFIKSQDVAAKAGEAGVFKITRDPRVTPIGRILRKTSLDELPQLWNVLRGEMSLVGPRPPLAYEVAEYKSWHLRRVFDAKPGITGLWQVSGRSRMTFDEMVRLDLRYAKTCSFAADLRILLATPRAVISGKGAC